jgi:signal transduction histidine kinase
LEPQWSAKNIELEAELIKTPYSGDEGLLSQVWINLLHNAIKFTPQGGQIHIQLSTNETGIAVKVSDTGLGISADDQRHIFERFYNADKARDRSLGGNGLGLSLVKKIVELHGGNVTVVSEFGKGAAFTVQIPKK